MCVDEEGLTAAGGSTSLVPSGMSSAAEYWITSAGARPHLMHGFTIFYQIFQHLHLHHYELNRRSPSLY